MLNQSFRQVFVSNIPALLPEGKTVDNIAIGQVGILNGSSNVATVAPTYGKDKAIKLVWGTPDIAPLFFSGYNNQNEYSKLIKGRLLRNFRGHKASRGQNQVITVGYSGSAADTDTLFAKPGEHRELFLNLTGDAIDREFSTQGLQRRYYYKKDFANDCEDACVDVDCREISEYLVKQINADKLVNRYVKASVITSCNPSVTPPASVTLYKFRISVPDAKDNMSLGLVQAQYPDDKVTRVGEDGLASVYEVTRSANTTPTTYSNAGNIVIPNCTTCPTGYTLINTGFAYKVVRRDAGDNAAKTAIATEFGIDNTESVARIGYEYGQSTYIVTSDTAIASVTPTNEVQSIVATGATAGTFTLTLEGETTGAIAYNANAATIQTALEGLSNITPGDIVVAGGALPATPVTITFQGKYSGQDVPTLVAGNGSMTGGNAVVTTPTPGVAGTKGLTPLGDVRESCLLNTPTTTAWAADGTVIKYAKAYRITLADDICGSNRLADLQAAYPTSVVTLVNGSGSCTHTYEITVYSQPIEAGCSVDVLSYNPPEKFEGGIWEEVPAAPLADGTTCLCGIKLEVAVVNRTTNEATFQYFPYDASTVFLEVSSGNADYNSSVPLENFWSVKQIQGVKYPQGAGGYIQKLEKDSLAYALKFRSDNPVIRELEGYQFQAQSGVFYDEYVLEFDFSYKVGGWSQTYTDSYSVFVYFPEGQGKPFETAINNYIASANIDLDPVVL